MNRLILFLILYSNCVFGQKSNLYRADKKMIADTIFQIDNYSYNNALIIEEVLLPRIYNKINYPELARENGIEGMVIVQILANQKDFKYKIVRTDNLILSSPIIEYFDHLDGYLIDQIKPSKGFLNIFIPIEFRLPKDQFYTNLKRYGKLIIETKDIAKQTDIIKE